MKNHDALENIYTRKSIRKYTEEEIEFSDLKQILKAAMSAPTARNKRPYHFVVVKEQEIKDKLAKAKSAAKMIEESYYSIVVCCDKDKEETIDFIHQDCAAATQNILLASHALNLGAVWIGVRQDDEKEFDKNIKKILDLPDNIIPVSIVAIGHPDQTREVFDTYEKEKVHFDLW